MSSTITRRRVVRSAAWAAPAVAFASAAPAATASCVSWNAWDVSYQNIEYVGTDGWLGTVSWWTVVTQGVKPADGCATATPVPSFTTTVTALRNAGGLNRIRTMSLTQADSVTVDTKTLDPARTSTHPVGSIDYQWTITFDPAAVYALNGQHRFYTTISVGDGGLIGGRITNQLQLDGITRNFQNQGDSIF